MARQIVLIVLLASAARAASGQTVDPSKDVKVHIGPLALSPALGLTNAGIDTNVFNEPDQAAPKSDFTMTVEPKSDVWLAIGRTWLTGNITEDLVYYEKYSNERSVNSSYRLGWLVPLTRITLNANAGYLNTHDRPGFEIDARTPRVETAFDGSAELRLLSRIFIGVKGRRQKVDFDKAAAFLSRNLRFELNRVVTSEALTLRHQVTTLTSLTLDVAREQDRFDFDRVRDSDSTAITGGVKFDPLALLKGSAIVGYRDFRPLSPGVPAYKGSIAQVDLSYVARGSTKLNVQVARDVQYSYDINNLYYVQTAVNSSIAQQLFGPVDIVGRVSAAKLDYRTSFGAQIADPNRIDSVRSFGGGLGYHLGGDVRVGFNVDKAVRSSDLVTRQYDDLRIGTSVTYGF
jgi:hypothetical protein